MKTISQELPLDFLKKIRKLDVFSTGQVAQICKVAPRTVSKWFDDTQGRYFRPDEIYYLPLTSASSLAPAIRKCGKRDGANRRFTRQGLIRFLREHGMHNPLALLEKPCRLVLYVGTDPLACERALGSGYSFKAVDDQNQAGHVICRDAPPLVVVDYKHPVRDIKPQALCDLIRMTDKISADNRPIVFGLCVKSTDDQARVDHFSISMETFRGQVVQFLPPDTSLRETA